MHRAGIRVRCKVESFGNQPNEEKRAIVKCKVLNNGANIAMPAPGSRLAFP